MLWAVGTYCIEEVPEVERQIDVTLNTSTVNPFAIQSGLKPEQRSGNADVLISYGPVTDLVKDGPVSRTPGKVIGWREQQVEVVFSRQSRGDYVKVFIAYDKDFNPDKLHDDKENIASCRFDTIGSWPTFHDCSREN